MNQEPLVSVIIIFLDEERFLAEAIESVRAQSYSNWELILVDDGSTDRSSAVALDAVAHHPEQIRYVEHPGHANCGMSASRNLGLAQARGQYVGFLDSDDVWLPHKLHEQVPVLEAYPQVAMIYGRTLIWRQWGDAAERNAAPDEFCDLGVSPDSVVEPPRLLVNLIENRAQTPTSCNALLRLEWVVRVGGFEDAFRDMFEDQVFFMKLCLVAPVYVSSCCWAKYRQRADSCSARAEASGRVPDARQRLLDWLETYLHDRQVSSPAVWRAWRRQRRPRNWLGRLLLAVQ
jgi:glycosyltransferase involved in cell wall biosynthesis